MAKPRLVVKVGTSTLLEEHELPTSTFGKVGASIVSVIDDFAIVLVTSGAIGFGVRRMGIDKRPDELGRLQALASIGQVGLMEQWNNALPDHTLGQVLVTARELKQDKNDLLNATFEEMWEMGVLPVVNENDAITNDEISFGDNDALAAHIAASIGAQYLLLLTDQDGVYADFGTDKQSRLSEIPIDAASAYVSERRTPHGTGGMASKLIAASIAAKAGVRPYIAGARQDDIIRRAISGESGTKLI